MTKCLVNCLYLKQVMYSFKMSEDIVLAEQLDMFNKLNLDLENIEVKIDDDNQVLLLSCVLPRYHVTTINNTFYDETFTLPNKKSRCKP